MLVCCWPVPDYPPDVKQFLYPTEELLWAYAKYMRESRLHSTLVGVGEADVEMSSFKEALEDFDETSLTSP